MAYSEQAWLDGLKGVEGRIKTAVSRAAALEAEATLAETRRLVGVYQRGDMGTLPAWRELSEYTKRDRVRKGYSENDPGLRDGTMRASYRAVPKQDGFIIGSPMEIALWFEKGTGRQPPRPVIALGLHRRGAAITEGMARAIMAEGTPRGRDV